ncbi:DUF3021 domain-containing protein [Levilactobacillus brevis]|uniref:DUF3021 domain-containing protein n=1 Tax=Levilactobacillus brevis TaxID=1580 RepID=UPI001F47B7C4|nr:DUF3021 domain-containing protein [Levilactobacillus brevis]MCE6034469.1 DUF3021 domain-containing protein [Levilactobacillus brevis]MCT3588150.1 DUF3021 domain-containing protein [Levilactobacillus brevis]
MKKIMNRSLFGISTGVSIGFVIALTFSFIYQSHNFVPSAPNFIAYFSSNTMATAFSTILWAGMGLVFSLSNMIFERDQWSITRQTFVHFGITYVCFTPLAILAGWFPLNAFWLIGYTIIYLLIYVSIWSASMLIAKKKVQELNRLIQKRK